jgi:hypothetical protein
LAKLPVEVFYDHEVDLWGYSVPVLNIVGTGCLSREDAERLVVETIEFVLEEEIDEPTEEAEIVSYDVQVARAS